MVQVIRLPKPERVWLPVHYAPRAGKYTVVSRVVGYRMDCLTVVGHVVLYQGKLRRFWFH